MLESRRILPLLGLLACLALALPADAAIVAPDVCTDQSAPACGDEERQAYLQAAEDGVPPDELNAQFAHCADGASPLGVSQKIITVNNGVGSTFYEQMNGCGVHPQFRLASCDVELKRRTWYGNFPWGSNEHVTFCFFCGGGWIPVPASVHVTNDVSGVQPSYGFAAFAQVPNACPAGGTGAAYTVRATLSWAVPATNPCNAINPGLTWGNQITFDTRDDP